MEKYFHHLVSQKNCVRKLVSYYFLIACNLLYPFLSYTCNFDGLPNEIQLTIASKIFDQISLNNLENEFEVFTKLRHASKTLHILLDNNPLLAKQFEDDSIKQIILKFGLNHDVLQKQLVPYKMSKWGHPLELVDKSTQKHIVAFKELQMLAVATQSAHIKNRVEIFRQLLSKQLEPIFNPNFFTHHNGEVVYLTSQALYENSFLYEHTIHTNRPNQQSITLTNKQMELENYPQIYCIAYDHQSSIYHTGRIQNGDTFYVRKHNGFNYQRYTPVEKEALFGMRILPNNKILAASYSIRTNMIRVDQFDLEGNYSQPFGGWGSWIAKTHLEPNKNHNLILAVSTTGRIIIGKQEDCSFVCSFSANGVQEEYEPTN